MSFGQQSPESLLPRSDSKNPATTCKGITSNGRPCRRGLAAPVLSSPPLSQSSPRGLLAVLEGHQVEGGNVAAFYCWQHKEQADDFAAVATRNTTLLPLKEKTSVDTLIDRLGVLEIDEETIEDRKRHHKRRRRDDPRVRKCDTLPSGWNDKQGPFTTVSKDFARPRPSVMPSVEYGRSNLKTSFLCCLRADDDNLPAPRPRHDPGSTGASTGRYVSAKHTASQQPRLSRRSNADTPPISVNTVSIRGNALPQGLSTQQQFENIYPVLPPLSPIMPSTPTPQVTHGSRSQTQSLLSLIPSSLSPITTSLLLAELSKPISTADDSGYIYMFWLTPESDASKPDDETASSILEPTTASSLLHQRRTSDALQRYSTHRRASSSRAAAEPCTILLKIGRASNVHRRLSQWAKQCSHNITLIRYYPYVGPSQRPSAITTAADTTAPSSPRKVPHVHRVERLVHLELSHLRAKDQGACASCGKEHREWFEVPATRDDLRAVDAVVRRWVAWAEDLRS